MRLQGGNRKPNLRMRYWRLCGRELNNRIVPLATSPQVDWKKSLTSNWRYKKNKQNSKSQLCLKNWLESILVVSAKSNNVLILLHSKQLPNVIQETPTVFSTARGLGQVTIGGFHKISSSRQTLQP